MSSELYHTIEAIGREKGIDTDVIIHAVEEAYAAASRKYYHSKEDFGARFDPDDGTFNLFSRHTVVEEEELVDPMTEMTVEDARKIDPDADIGTVIETPKGELIDAPLTRIAAQAAKQVIYQKVKEAEREIVWREYGDRVGDLLTGQVKRFDRGDMIVDLGRAEAIITRREQSRAEHYNPGDRIRAVLVHVERQGKGPQLMLSRAHELLVRKLFEMEVPEIYDGTVSIVSVARDAGERTKIAVRSKDRDVDPVGACVGMKGSRVQAVIRELRGEKIDIVQYDDDANNYVRNALNPAAINRVGVLDYELRDMEVIVSEDQLSLAIGRRGQNVRLASKLVGWNLDIKSEQEKKAEVEDEMERLAIANQELSRLPGVSQEVATCLLDAGFRSVAEVTQASLEDLTSIEGIEEETAIDIHDAAEELLVVLEQEYEEQRIAAEAAEAEAAAAAEAEAAEAEAAEGEAEEAEATAGEADADAEAEAATAGDEPEAATDDATIEASAETGEDDEAATEAATEAAAGEGDEADSGSDDDARRDG
jgi:N utilization substance protein A